MKQSISITAEDGFSLRGYLSAPAGKSRGGIVVMQEIFGVNHHIRSICHRLSAAGFTALAPAMFDRIEPGFEVGYSAEENARARTFISRIDWSNARKDTDAAIAFLKASGPVGIIGFCFGGTSAYAAATRDKDLVAAVSFYGGQIAKYAEKPLYCAAQLHFAEFDDHVPVSDVDKIRSLKPETEIYVYPAKHGFNCDEREAFEPESAAIGWARTIQFLDRHFPK